MKTKTVRFSHLVKTFGQPEVLALWVEPNKDPNFKRAIAENRVVTLKQANVGTKRDFGLVGFYQQRQASFLVFPLSLTYEAGTKVVGIKYELVAAKAPPDVISVAARLAWGSRPKHHDGEPHPTNRDREPESERYQVTFGVQAIVEVPIEVEASDRTEARLKAHEILSKKQINFSGALMKTRVLKIEPV